MKLQSLVTGFFFITVCITSVSCFKKDGKPDPYVPPTPAFRANIAGTLVEFNDKIIVSSKKSDTANKYMLTILAEKKISVDSTIIIRFTVEDFTRPGSFESKSFPLNTNFPGNLIEWMFSPTVSAGRYHFFQNGTLDVVQIGADYINGRFQFTYFLYDEYGQKLSEQMISNGFFENLFIKRMP